MSFLNAKPKGKQYFSLRSGSIVYKNPNVILGNTTFKDFEAKPCSRCGMLCELFELDNSGKCELCIKVDGWCKS